MNLKQLMTEPLVFVNSETPVSHVIHLMNKHRLTSIPVVDQRRCVMGIVTQRELFNQKPIPSDDKLLTMRVDEVMSSDVSVADESDELSEVAWRMVHHGLDVMLIVNHGVLVGLLSRNDLIRMVARAV